ncbi:MAG: MBL fold metallo-hydrolase, partial [Methylophilus sp.]
NELRYLNEVITDVREAIKNGGSMQHTMDTAAASERDKWLLFDVANRRNVNTIFSALEWE